MKPRIAGIAICALLLLPVLAVATPAANAVQAAPALSWSQLLAAVSQAVLPSWGTPAAPARGHAPAARPHRQGRRFLVTCDASQVLDPNGHCIVR
jgi:hypothetical protein